MGSFTVTFPSHVVFQHRRCLHRLMSWELWATTPISHKPLTPKSSVPSIYLFYFDALQLAQMNWPRLERVVVVVTDNN